MADITSDIVVGAEWVTLVSAAASYGVVSWKEPFILDILLRLLMMIHLVEMGIVLMLSSKLVELFFRKVVLREDLQMVSLL